MEENSTLTSENIRVSVIVPVYNASDYLRECLDCIVSQTLKETEIICVDDGSTDDSLMILKEYAQKDSRIKVLEQKNSYAGVARNNGKAVAKGKYLVFWDSDDRFKEEALSVMYEKCEADNADICICRAERYFPEMDESLEDRSYMLDNMLPENIPFSMDDIPGNIMNFTKEVPWNKMFKREFVMETGLDFQARRNGNDVFFVMSSLCLAKRITVVTDPLIIYRKNNSSSLMGTLDKNPTAPLEAWIDVAEYLKSFGRFPERSFVNKAISVTIYMLNQSKSRAAFEKSFGFLKEHGLDDLGIDVKEEGFYIYPHYDEFAAHLRNDDIDDFLRFLADYNYRTMMESQVKEGIKTREAKQFRRELKLKTKEAKSLERQLNTLRGNYEDIKNSASYKIGRVITAPVRKIRGDRVREPEKETEQTQESEE
ncbi:MAG: glycosyltransferase [Lachnospiraceae bacterium]|nr:glycosyltransferase [Lachnospiraceae bacterium]